MSFEIALVNMIDGSVQGHKAGCADLKRGAKKFADEPWPMRVDAKRDAFLEYNSDFLAEAEAEGDFSESNTYSITWLPCANHVPEGEAPATIAAFLAWAETPAEVTRKDTGKWTRFYDASGYEVGRVRSAELAQIASLLNQ